MRKKQPKRKTDNQVVESVTEQRRLPEQTHRVLRWPNPTDDLRMVSFSSSPAAFFDEVDAWVQRYLELAEVALRTDQDGNEDDQSKSA